MKKNAPLLIILALLITACVLAVTQPSPSHYPFVEIRTPDQIELTVLLSKRTAIENCEATLGKIISQTLSTCPTCAILQAECVNTLTPSQQKILSEQPLDTPSGRMRDGFIVFSSSKPDQAQAACSATESASSHVLQSIQCFAANSPRPVQNTNWGTLLEKSPQLLVMIIVAGMASWLCGWLAIKYEHLHGRYSYDLTNGPQKFHSVPIPRIGGLLIFVGLIGACTVMLLSEAITAEREFALLLIASIPAFIGGLVEDVTKKVSVLQRLLLTMVSGAVGAWLLGGVLHRLDIPGFDYALTWLPFAVIFTAFAISGVTNAFNIIDGFNGLASGYAVIVLAALAGIAVYVTDEFILISSLAMMGTLIGFLKWNWPGGRIFLGDGGAYTLGFIIAELSVLLVQRHPNISPWFPVALLIYPIFETLFTMYRRKVIRRQTPGDPDCFHLHQLIYLRLVRKNVTAKTKEHLIQRNASVAPYLWIWNGLLVVPFALAFHPSTARIQLVCLSFIASYLWLYGRIVKRRSPKFLISSEE